MQKYWGSFDVKYKGDLLELADLLTKNIFHTEFEKSDIYEEVPALVSKEKVLGFFLILSESKEASWFILEIKGQKYCSDKEKDNDTRSAEDLFSEYIKSLLEDIGLKVEFTRNIKN